MDSAKPSRGEDISGISFLNVSGLSRDESHELYKILGVAVPEEEPQEGNNGTTAQVPETHIHAGSPITFFVESKLTQEEIAGTSVGLPVPGRVYQYVHNFCQGLPPFGVTAVPIPMPVVSEDMTPDLAAYFANQPPPTMCPPGQNVNAIAFVPGMTYPLLPAPAATEQPPHVPILPFVPVGLSVPPVPVVVPTVAVPVPTTSPSLNPSLVTTAPSLTTTPTPHQPVTHPQAVVKVVSEGNTITNGTVPGNCQVPKRVGVTAGSVPGIKDSLPQPHGVEMPPAAQEPRSTTTATDINKNVKPMPPASFCIPPVISSHPVSAPSVATTSSATASSSAPEKSISDKKSQSVTISKPGERLQNGVVMPGENNSLKCDSSHKLIPVSPSNISTKTTAAATATSPVADSNNSPVVNGYSSPPELQQPPQSALRTSGDAVPSDKADVQLQSAPVSEPEVLPAVPSGFPALGSGGGARPTGGGFLNGTSSPFGAVSGVKNAVDSENSPKVASSVSESQPGVAASASEEPKVDGPKPVLSFAAAAAAPPAKKSYAFCVKGNSSSSQAPASIVNYKPDSDSEKSASSPTTSEAKSKETSVVSVENDVIGMKLGKFLQAYVSNHAGVPLIPRGMTNTSNWCFMNSTLQAFMSAPQVYHLLKNMGSIMGGDDRRQSSTPICDSLVKLVNEFSRAGRQNNSRRGRNAEVEIGQPFDPTYIRNLLISHDSFSKSYKNGRQEDAHEFFQALVNGSHEEQALLIKHATGKNNVQSNGFVENGCGGENTEDDSSDGDGWLKVDSKGKAKEVNMDVGEKTPMKQIFGGVSVRTIYQAGRGERQTYEGWNDLIMESHHGSIIESLTSLPTKETTQTDTGVEISHQTRIEVLPEVLVFTYKTFQYDHNTGASEKIIKDFKFSVDLDIPKEILTPNARSRIPTNQRSYKLCAVVSHLGKKATGGHYTTVTFDIASQCWLLKDDGLVTVIPESKVLQYYVDNVTHQMPYMLFYRQRHSLPQNGTERH